MSASNLKDTFKTFCFCLIGLLITFVLFRISYHFYEKTDFPQKKEHAELSKKLDATEILIFNNLVNLKLIHPELNEAINKTYTIEKEAAALRQEAKDLHALIRPGEVIGKRRGGTFYPKGRYKEVIELNRTARQREGTANTHISQTARQFYPLLGTGENNQLINVYEILLSEDDYFQGKRDIYRKSWKTWVNLGLFLLNGVLILGMIILVFSSVCMFFILIFDLMG